MRAIFCVQKQKFGRCAAQRNATRENRGQAAHLDCHDRSAAWQDTLKYHEVAPRYCYYWGISAMRNLGVHLSAAWAPHPRGCSGPMLSCEMTPLPASKSTLLGPKLQRVLDLEHQPLRML